MESRHAQNPENQLLQPDDQLLPIGETARLLGVSVETVRRWDAAGEITSVRTIGGQRRFRRSEIERVAGVEATDGEAVS